MNAHPLFRGLFAIGFLATSIAAMAEEASIQVLSAVVKDQHIQGATVILQKNGAQSATAITNSNGMVTLSPNFADSSDALVIIKKPGYSTLVAKCPCKGMSYAISPHMAALDGLRIVLNWGSTPQDLDSHIAYPNNHIFFAHKEGTQANLDVDDTDGFGPETITVDKKIAGQAYVYAVHDFTNQGRPNSTELSNSRAKVLVYIGQSLVRSYYVPKNTKGNLWTVFRITEEGEFQDINTMRGVVSDSWNVLGNVETYLDRRTQVEAHAISMNDEKTAKDLNRQGETLYHQGDIDGSVDYYRQAIDIDSNFGQAYSNLGLAYQKLGRTSEAIWANRKAIALATGNSAPTVRASSYYNIAKIYEQAGQYQDALNHYSLAKNEKANPVYDKAIERVKNLLH